MEFSIKKFDAYHKLARSKALTLQEANAKLGCTFQVRSSDVQKAYVEYEQHYKKIIMEDNCAPGEPIQQRILSFKYFLNKQNLVKGTEQRKMFIGTHGKTESSKNINRLRRLALNELKEEEVEFKTAVPLNLKAIKTFKNMEAEKAEKETKLKKKIEQANSVINSSLFLKHLKSITSNLTTNEKKIWNDSLYFVPKDEALQNLKEEDIKGMIMKHAFENKNDVVKKLEQWKLAFNDPTKQAMAKNITIVNRNNEELKVGNIAYSLQSCKKLIERVKDAKNMTSAYFLPLVNKKLI